MAHGVVQIPVGMLRAIMSASVMLSKYLTRARRLLPWAAINTLWPFWFQITKQKYSNICSYISLACSIFTFHLTGLLAIVTSCWKTRKTRSHLTTLYWGQPGWTGSRKTQSLTPCYYTTSLVNFLHPQHHSTFPWPTLKKNCLRCFDTVGWVAGRASGL